MEEEKIEKTFGKKGINKKKKNSWIKFLAGDILTEDFVIKQSKMVLWVVLLILIFISNRYSCVKKLAEIQELNMKLKHLEYENLIISTNLTTRSRQSQIENLLEMKGIDLSTSKKPAIEIRK
jgi:predicted membrane protein